MRRILCLDVESNGLHGEEIAIGAAILGGSGTVVQGFEGEQHICVEETFSGRVARLPKKMDSWVRENVFPQIQDLPEYKNPRALREAFWAWFKVQKRYCHLVVTDCGYPVETGFLCRCQRDNLEERDMAGPYPLHELATLLLAAGVDPDISREEFAGEVKFQGGKHNPLWDAVVSGICALKAQEMCEDSRRVFREYSICSLGGKHDERGIAFVLPEARDGQCGEGPSAAPEMGPHLSYGEVLTPVEAARRWRETTSNAREKLLKMGFNPG